MIHQQKSRGEEWAQLCEKRLLRKEDVSFLAMLNRLEQTNPQDYTVIDIRLNSCRTFAEVTEYFADAFRFPAWFGENADALYDLLTDLPGGRYIVRVTGCKVLDKKLLLKLEMVLKAKREGGFGYKDGEVVFVLV